MTMLVPVRNVAVLNLWAAAKDEEDVGAPMRRFPGNTVHHRDDPDTG
jgi:hypothetical protein